VPLLTPILFALVIAPALKQALHTSTAYEAFVATGTIGLLIPLNTMLAGLGVIVDRESGAQRELLAAPIPRPLLVLGNLVILPLTHALALVRYGLLGDSSGLHNIWNMHNTTMMATLSLAVVATFRRRTDHCLYPRFQPLSSPLKGDDAGAASRTTPKAPSSSSQPRCCSGTRASAVFCWIAWSGPEEGEGPCHHPHDRRETRFSNRRPESSGVSSVCPAAHRAPGGT
jgi:hypothetical protein